MKILLTNDDGFEAMGINILNEILEKHFDTYILAPSEEKSACSNAVTIKNNIGVNKINDRCYSVDGFPADCVNIALNTNFVPEPDLIISGINHGPNLGDDVYYSGTVGAARTAYIHGKNAIAISLDSHDMWTKGAEKYKEYFYRAAEYLLEELKKNSFLGDEIPFLTNINYPVIEENKVLGSKLTFLGKRHYIDSYTVDTISSKYDYELKLTGTVESDELKGSDVTEIRKGYITVTPLGLDCTDYNRL